MVTIQLSDRVRFSVDGHEYAGTIVEIDRRSPSMGVKLTLKCISWTGGWSKPENTMTCLQTDVLAVI